MQRGRGGMSLGRTGHLTLRTAAMVSQLGTWAPISSPGSPEIKVIFLVVDIRIIKMKVIK